MFTNRMLAQVVFAGGLISMIASFAAAPAAVADDTTCDGSGKLCKTVQTTERMADGSTTTTTYYYYYR